MAKKPTTPPELNADDGNVAAEEKPEFRQSIFDSISDRRSEIIASGLDPEAGTDDDEDDLPAAAADDDAADADDGEEDQRAAVAADDGDDQPDSDDADPEAAPTAHRLGDDDLVEIVVDGETQQVPFKQVKAGMQIEAAARARMQEATQLRDAMRSASEEFVRQRGTEQPQPAEARQAPQPDAPNPLEKIDWSDLARSMQYDDPEESGAKLRDVVAQLRQPVEASGNQVNPDELRNSVLSQVRNTLEWDSAMKDLGEAYNDILSDPYLASLAGARSNFYLQQELGKERQGQRRRPFYAALSQGADEIRQWAQAQGMKVAGAGDSADDSPDPNDQPGVQVQVDSDQRNARKAAASGKQPQPRTVRQRRTVPQQGEMPSEVKRSRSAIEDIQRQRGQLAS